MKILWSVGLYCSSNRLQVNKVSGSSSIRHSAKLAKTASEAEDCWSRQGHCGILRQRWCWQKHRRRYVANLQYAILDICDRLISEIANLSLAFARLGYRAGILDTDIFGPSIPTLFDLSGEPRLSNSKKAIIACMLFLLIHFKTIN